MKRLILVGMLNAMLVPTWLAAQRGGGSGGGRGTGVAGRLAPPPAGPINRAPRLDGSGQNLLRGRGDSYAYDGLGWSGYPYFGDYGYLPGYNHPGDQSPAANIVVEPVQNWAPDPPARPTVHEYQWPTSEDNPAAVFSIVTKDGTVHRAIAVWAQDGAVCFFTPEGAGGQLPIGTVDRERTQQLNAAHRLKLPLPAVAAAN